MTDEPRELDWQRFPGAHANIGKSPAGRQSIVGVAPDICPCCDERYIVIAAVHAGGVEVSVALAPAEALQLANKILDGYAKVSLTPKAARQ